MENQQSMQEQYLAVIKQIIEDNIGNEHFSVADLAREAGLSRSMLHRKLIRLTGKSATDLITEIRLTRAYEFLENDAGTVSEIAYRVGYSSPSYFNKVFKKKYKVSAGEVRRKGSGKIPHLRVIKEPGVPGSSRSKRSLSEIIAGTNISMIIIVIGAAIALLLGLMDHVSPFSRMPDRIVNLILIILIAGFIIAIILYWIFDGQRKGIDESKSIGEPGELEKPSPGSKRGLKLSDVIIVVLILVVGILAYPRIFGPENLKNITFPVRVLNESGEWETHRVYKEDYITRLLLFPFTNETTDSSLDWMGLGIMEAVFEDQRQFSNMQVDWARTPELKAQTTAARNGKYPHFLTGTYRMDGSMYEITTSLHQTSNGTVLNADTLRGVDFFILLDSICSKVRRDLHIAEIILDATQDLLVSTLMTNHLGAYEHYINGKYWNPLNVDAYSNLHRAIELDPSFALAYYQLALYCFIYQASHISGVKSIDKAINLRHRMSDLRYKEASILDHMINRDLERMIRLSELQVRLRPRDFTLLRSLLYDTYWTFWMLDLAKEIAVKLNKLVPLHPGYQLLLAENFLFSGQPRKTRKVLKKLLAENPDHMGAMLMLGQAYLHENKLEAAEEIFENAILLMPDHKEYLSYFLAHIQFVKNTENMEEVLESFVGSSRSEDGEFSAQAFRIQDQICSKTIQQAGLFFYPVSDSEVFSVFGNDFLKSTRIFSDKGKPIKGYGWQLSISEHDLLSDTAWWWNEDSLILRANGLLAEGLPREALTAFRKAYEENPEHYYLANFIRHLQLVTDPGYDTLKSVLKAYAGTYEYTGPYDYKNPYGDMRIKIDQDQYYYIDKKGLIFELLPLSEDAFMVPSRYVLTIQIVKEKGVVTGLKYICRDGKEEFYPRIQEVAMTQQIN